MVSVLDVRPTMVPPDELLTDALPTDRLTATGMPVPEVRAELRRIDDLRSAGTVVATWAQALGTIGLAVWIGHPLAYVAAFVLMGPAFARFAILAHEAAHKLLFTNKRCERRRRPLARRLPRLRAARRLPTGPLRAPQGRVRAQRARPQPLQRLPRHRGQPPSEALARRPRHVGLEEPQGPPARLHQPVGPAGRIRIAVAQVPLVVAAIAVGRWWLYPLLWLGPWMTVWRVINRLRSIAEHGGMMRSKDRRQTTHHVRQSWLARFWLVPLNTGWHLAHHVDMGVPWRNLPRLHAELEAAGYITPELTYPSYRALWRALGSRPEPADASA